MSTATMSLIYIFKFQLIEFGMQGIDPPSKSQTVTNNVVSMLNNSGTANASFKSLNMSNNSSTNASPVAKVGTSTRVSEISFIRVSLCVRV